MFTGKPGGYKDGSGTPTDFFATRCRRQMSAGHMIQGLKARHIYDATLFIVSAKHGQSPINQQKPTSRAHLRDLVARCRYRTTPAPIAIANANACTPPAQQACGFVQDDDIALIWLQDRARLQLLPLI